MEGRRGQKAAWLNRHIRYNIKEEKEITCRSMGRIIDTLSSRNVGSVDPTIFLKIFIWHNNVGHNQQLAMMELSKFIDIHAVGEHIWSVESAEPNDEFDNWLRREDLFLIGH
jgi:hypothetical protein